MSAEYLVNGSVAVITLNNPPVNGLGLETRTAAVAGIRRALADDAVKAIVITGAGKAFSGGADIKEFNSPKALTEPTLHTLIQVAESSTKPVVAAIHTVCMGGGLELALGCNYRVAMPGAQIALPEVKLGLLPGAGGTQRLPRVVGLEMALNMIVSGTPVPSEKFAGTALFDEVFASDAKLIDSAVAFANKVADVRPLPRVRDRKVNYPNHEAFLQFSRNTVKAMSGAFPAPMECVETVAASVTRKFEDGIKFERERFLHLIQTPESKSLRHAFFAERLASKIPDVPADTPTREIKQAAIIGAGTMGGGIAMNFVNAGIPVILLETKQEALDKGIATIRKNYENTMKKGKLTPEKFEQRVGLISGTLNYADIAQADIVVEAVFEDMGVKESVFKQLDSVMKPGAILASNTSTLDVNKIAGFTSRPQDVVGTHFFSPANVMKLLEIVRGAKTGKDVLATTLALSKKLRKTGVVSGVCDGFIGNRMIEQYSRQAGFLLEEGCLPEQVDKAVEKFGFAMGPFRMGDLAGNDIGWYIRKRRYVESPEITYSKTADLLCEMGRYGQKTGAGWYDYKAGDRKAYASQDVNDMIVKHSADIGVERRKISDEEIVERLVYSLVNEGARILEEGIAMRASDIDMVYLTGYGFPVFRGGPMFYADTVGLANVLMAMEKYAKGRHGNAWAPAPLMVRLAAEGKGFNS
ncbi:3-hydroxyacyl-CoA dehydrogenase NAD-binding domain-containing protein [Massilia antarctica]|uniref:3-hydroxyacyl-CoA dehydrogenase NAD-binding domain-containing protein n=1 Tax=Massilia antarctica TaxID=2765360 RepID=UPI0006BB5640|nr:3-hydroxyacyl-CoA dehydrogenase NAD-binding domain-containing protein [Massilia sp. H27-R4]MCY0916275.1 3-hydroxyacyl-CoA dehydrogenase NAD-binding domain-containing protein [Massilia sp. H27-R4]CUI02960.1 Enoyl-CoA hydratase / Delta(3)-cis-delta(2)-trans-enoyl-CoA isomerase / 3-hydroxyacyl-CoA dehydrogenase / 3-hydroxybutyryl-CoA epimerase [Janthinobacterium sp. CG23_2]CUU26746.1 Enoyl-CoA hydratase / Delta(3)-cis-delta(2)-trans-enoyl-CoA isomerase / 3-hydroxyacyl-CoA dehydrogenase / 3-hydro